MHVNDATVFAAFESLGTEEFFVSIGAGLKIDFIKSGSTTSGSAGYIKVDNISIGDVNNEIVFSASTPGGSTSTDTVYYATSALPVGLSQGMFLQVVGPTTHPAYNEQRRILTIGTGITVANKFSGNLVGAIVRILKRSNTITFDATISSSAPTGEWDVVVTNPDLNYCNVEEFIYDYVNKVLVLYQKSR